MLLAQTAQPKLGLTLSGGGAKGLAHIGVLEVLEANGIVPDYLTGTSMGSIVGGLYAIGYAPDELLTIAADINWDEYFIDSYDRTFLPIEDRSRADRYQLSFAVEKGKLQLPRGILGGKKILTLLTGLTAPVHTIPDFDKFYIPFRCIATDLESGEAFVFDGGPLRKAIRASMSIPSAFDPLEYEGHLLVDGLLVRNLPVSDAKDMGADFVIAVDVGDPLYPREELQSVLKVLEQTSSFGMAAFNEEQLALSDFLIDPDLSGYSTLSYDATDSLIERGRQATLDVLPALLDTLAAQGIPLGAAPRRPNWRRDSFPISAIELQGNTAATTQTLSQLVRIKTPSVVTIEDLRQMVGRLYSSGFFSSVDYQFAHIPGGGYELQVIAEGSPDYYLRGSINYDVDFNAGLLVNFTARNRLLKGSVLSLDGRISEYPGAWLDYAVYTRSNPSIGLNVYGNAQILPANVYSQGELIDELTFHNYKLGFDLQSSISRQWHFKLGLQWEYLSENPRFFSIANEESQVKQWWTYAQFIRDTYDRSYFPKDGSLTQAWMYFNLGGELENFGAEREVFNTNAIGMAGAKTRKVFRLSPKSYLDFAASGGVMVDQNDHPLNRFYLGRSAPRYDRYFQVYGLALAERPASVFGYGLLQYRREVGKDKFIGLGYNAGYSWLTNYRRLLTEGSFHGLGLELGAITALGPVRFTMEYNFDYERLNFTFFAGYRF